MIYMINSFIARTFVGIQKPIAQMDGLTCEQRPLYTKSVSIAEKDSPSIIAASIVYKTKSSLTTARTCNKGSQINEIERYSYL